MYKVEVGEAVKKLWKQRSEVARRDAEAKKKQDEKVIKEAKKNKNNAKPRKIQIGFTPKSSWGRPPSNQFVFMAHCIAWLIRINKSRHKYEQNIPISTSQRPLIIT